MNTPRLEFYFDVQCPFAYVGSTQVRSLAARAGAEIDYRPMLLGGIYNGLAGGGPYAEPKAPARLRWDAMDITRWAEYFEVPLKFPKGHPVRTVLAMRAILASGDTPRACHALFEAAWGRGEDVSRPEVVIATLEAAGFDDAAGIVERASDPAVKRELRDRTDEALSRGVFGAPTFFIGDQMLWGQDRLDFVARALGQPGYAPDPQRSAPPAEEVEFWFDYASPYAYLGATQIERIAREGGAKVVYRPFLLGGLFRAIGTKDTPVLRMPPPKQRYYSQDMNRWAEHWDVPFKFASRFPMRTITPLRLTYAFLRDAPEQAPALIQAIFRALWVDDRDISQPEELAAICTEANLRNDLLERVGDPAIKQTLIDAGAEGAKRGFCGAPTFSVRGRFYWGQDRLPMVLDAIRGFEPSV